MVVIELNAKAKNVSKILNNNGLKAREFQQEKVREVIEKIPKV